MTITIVVQKFVYYIISLYILLFQVSLCSLLSRFKNRYEYIPQGRIAGVSTEDLYDFVFTNSDIMDKDEASLETYATLTLPVIKFYTVHYEASTKLNTINDKYEISQLNQNISAKLKHLWDQWTVTSSVKLRPTIKFNLTPECSTTPSETTRLITFPRESMHLIFLKKISPKIAAATSKYSKKTPASKISTYPWIVFRRRPKPDQKPTRKTTKRKSRKNMRKITKAINNTIEANSTLPSYINKILRTPLKSSCYLCGLNESEIPVANCYHIFEGHDHKFRLRQNSFKVNCIYSKRARQFKNIYYGPWYRGGCFKRFLDVGIEYNERGCRTYDPIEGKSFASERFSKLENLLSNVEDGCVSSPHASLTPFNRAISLFTHYHVCVCNEKYCNNANNMSCNILIKSFTFVYFSTLIFVANDF